MATDDRVAVVISPVTTFYDSGWKSHVAAFAELGLTSFGDTPDSALVHLKENFRAFIHTHRDQGVLEETLDRMGVRWHWEDEYPADGPAYENTNLREDPVEAVAVQQAQVDVLPSEVWKANTDLGMAA